MDTSGDTRMERGMQILHEKEIRRNRDGTLIVPSQTVRGDNYRVDVRHDICTCPDYVHRRVTCKHIHAASLWILMKPREATPAMQSEHEEAHDQCGPEVPRDVIRCPACQSHIELCIQGDRVVDLRHVSG